MWQRASSRQYFFMGTFHTVIFADLTGSTGVFEALGNQKATLAVTRLTQLMAQALPFQ